MPYTLYNKPPNSLYPLINLGPYKGERTAYDLYAMEYPNSDMVDIIIKYGENLDNQTTELISNNTFNFAGLGYISTLAVARYKEYLEEKKQSEPTNRTPTPNSPATIGDTIEITSDDHSPYYYCGDKGIIIDGDKFDWFVDFTQNKNHYGNGRWYIPGDPTDKWKLLSAPTPIFTPEQTRALWESAEHWLNDNVFAKHYNDVSTSAATCSCCEEFLDDDEDECYNCPIKQFTNEKLCNNSPYDFITSLRSVPSRFSDLPMHKFRVAAELEYRFLVSLALGEHPETGEPLKLSDLRGIG